MNSYLKQDNVAPQPPHNFILFELDFDVKFPLLRLLLFLSALKSTITRQQIDAKIQSFRVNDLKRDFVNKNSIEYNCLNIVFLISFNYEYLLVDR